MLYNISYYTTCYIMLLKSQKLQGPDPCSRCFWEVKKLNSIVTIIAIIISISN